MRKSPKHDMQEGQPDTFATDEKVATICLVPFNQFDTGIDPFIKVKIHIFIIHKSNHSFRKL